MASNLTKPSILSSLKSLKIKQNEINAFNKQLEKVIDERTRSLVQKNKQLNEYAFYNAHELRAPLATILGLNEILKIEKDHQIREFIIEKVMYCISKLDEIVIIGQKMLDETED